MSRNNHNIEQRRPRLRRWAPFCVALVIAVMIPSQASAVNSALWRSLLLPGSGQAHMGNYGRAALFAGAAIISATGLLVSQIQYNQSVDKFDDAKADYEQLYSSWNNGEVVSVSAAGFTYDEMTSAQDEADVRLQTRNIFLGALIVTYTLNLVDVLISKPHDPELAMRYQVDANPRRVLVTRSFGF